MTFNDQPRRLLSIRPRYYRWHVDPGVGWTEANTGYAALNWEIPLEQAAVVCVDVWDRHYLSDTHMRAELIIRERIAPLLAACRRAGLQVVHAPSPELAAAYPERLVAADTTQVMPAHQDDWPPAEFRSREGPYAQYARPPEARDPERADIVSGLRVHPLAEPEGSDIVIATGDDLHAVCADRGALFLFYLGFNTNACILLRDYGTLKMAERGYCILILRDCGTAMESFQTRHALSQTTGTVLFLEMFGAYSLSSDELIAGLPA